MYGWGESRLIWLFSASCPRDNIKCLQEHEGTFEVTMSPIYVQNREALNVNTSSRSVQPRQSQPPNRHYKVVSY